MGSEEAVALALPPRRALALGVAVAAVAPGRAAARPPVF